MNSLVLTYNRGEKEITAMPYGGYDSLVGKQTPCRLKGTYDNACTVPEIPPIRGNLVASLPVRDYVLNVRHAFLCGVIS